MQFCVLEVSLTLGSLCRLTHMNTDLQQRAAHIESLKRAMEDLRYKIEQKDGILKWMRMTCEQGKK